MQNEIFLKQETIDYMGPRVADKTLIIKTTKDLWSGELVTNIQSGHNCNGARITQIGGGYFKRINHNIKRCTKKAIEQAHNSVMSSIDEHVSKAI